MQFEVAVCHVRLPGLVTFEKLNHRRGAINLAFKASSSKRGKLIMASLPMTRWQQTDSSVLAQQAAACAMWYQEPCKRLQPIRLMHRWQLCITSGTNRGCEHVHETMHHIWKHQNLHHDQ
jgi:hypothetical protein